MIQKLGAEDFDTIYDVINDAATAYEGEIPPDCYNQPYMTKGELKEEIASGVEFFGFYAGDCVVAVMGIQPVGDVTLIRHAYTLTKYQNRGIGAQLLHHLLALAKTDCVLVGTWEKAPWAIRFYQKHGFELTSREETDKLLHKYWSISERQVETSVVLKLQRCTS